MITKSSFSSGASSGRPLRIYLIDPVHNFVQSRDIWTIPLNILTIASYTKAAFGDQVDIRMFKFPDLAMQAIEETPPDIVGTSNYIWNCGLSKIILQFAKKLHSDTVTVMGGPNVTQSQPRMRQFLKEAHCDYYVSGAGEHPFKCLIGSMLRSDKDWITLHEAPEVHGVWYLDPATEVAICKPVAHAIKDLDEIPSAFENGMVDEFFQQGLMPMIETNRGCPFTCTYCDWGDSTFGKVYRYSIDRVKADIDYCRRHSNDERLMINDANFGLLGRRDLEIAKFMKHLRGSYGWPGKIIITWGQAKSDIVLRVADILKDLCMMTQSSQSMNPEVLKNIKRKNIPDVQWEKSVSFCKEEGIDTYGELMVPLPGETLRSYLAAVRYLFNLGVDFINTNPLILLEGAEISTSEERKKYQLVTKWRLLENCYGVYNGRKAIEYQEMVIQTNTFSTEDYFLCRVLSWLIQMSWNLRRHDLLLRLIQSFGMNPVDFLIEVIRNYQKAAFPVRAIFESFFKDAREEFFPTKGELISFYSTPEQIEFLRKGGFRKLNTYYAGRVWLDCNREFIDYYETVAREMINKNLMAPANDDKMIHDCARFVQQRYLANEDLIELKGEQDINKEVRFRYDHLLWSGDATGRSLLEFYCAEGVTYRFFVDEEQRTALREHLRRFSGMSREYQLRKLQEPYHGIHKKHLVFRIEHV